MKFYRTTCVLTFGGLLALAVCMPAIAQQSANLVSSEQGGSASAAQNTPATEDSWHFGITPYLWFAGMHGTTGVRGYNASVHASFGDLISHFDIGLMGAVEARKNRFLLPVDIMWMRLSDNNGLPQSPFPDATSIKVKMDQTVLTPKVGYRVVDHEKLKADGTVGIRYFHMGEKLILQPSDVSRSGSANWVDVVGGGRFTLPVSPEVDITVLGDAGGGAANLDYQIAGLLGYKITPSIILQGGWRYMYVNYRPGSTFVYDVVTSGVLVGATFYIK